MQQGNKKGLLPAVRKAGGVFNAPHYGDLGTIHPQGRAKLPASSGRALPACKTTPRTSAALRQPAWFEAAHAMKQIISQHEMI
jgi:hypothetical protein